MGTNTVEVKGTWFVGGKWGSKGCNMKEKNFQNNIFLFQQKGSWATRETMLFAYLKNTSRKSILGVTSVELTKLFRSQVWWWLSPLCYQKWSVLFSWFIRSFCLRSCYFRINNKLYLFWSKLATTLKELETFQVNFISLYEIFLKIKTMCLVNYCIAWNDWYHCINESERS